MANLVKAGVVGAGSFGLAVSLLLAENTDVVILTRNEATANGINSDHTLRGVSLPENVEATTNPAVIASACRTIFPVVPSSSLRETMRIMAPYLRPMHFIIHCTKGLDVVSEDHEVTRISRSGIRTMSEVIAEETAVLRIGCMSGPNLAREIIEGQPTATLIASEFTEVIDTGRALLSSSRFFVFGSHDLIGAELGGALKNVFALGSGYLAGRGLGKNIQSMLITRGLHEMIYLGKSLGTSAEAFLGTAGIADLLATATSNDSRNYRCGYLVGKGASLAEAEGQLEEVAEGVRTLKIAMQLSNHYDIPLPIIRTLYGIFYEDLAFDVALEYLMSYPYTRDVDFL